MVNFDQPLFISDLNTHLDVDISTDSMIDTDSEAESYTDRYMWMASFLVRVFLLISRSHYH